MEKSDFVRNPKCANKCTHLADFLTFVIKVLLLLSTITLHYSCSSGLIANYLITNGHSDNCHIKYTNKIDLVIVLDAEDHRT